MLGSTGKDRGRPVEGNNTRSIILKLTPLALSEENLELTELLDSMTVDDLEIVEEYPLQRDIYKEEV